MSTTETLSTPPPAKPTVEPLVRLEGVKKHFPITRGIIFQRKVGAVHAVDGVDLEIFPGETLGLVGETGCGKSTLARVVMRLHSLTEGKLWFDGRDVSNIRGRDLRDLRRDMQMVFQDPYASLNPRKTVGSIIGAPFRLHGTIPKNKVKGEVQQLMELVGLNPEHYNRYPHEFSGGQRQRIGVARSLALRPKLIVCDEPVSALDVSIQAQILNLLEDLQNEFHLTYLFIAHDLSVVKHVSDRVSVMYLGKIVETAERDSLYAQPRHPYTGALMSAVPVPDPKLAKAKRRIILEGDVPSPNDPPSMSDITGILSAAAKGDAHAAEQLLPLVYDELRRLAAAKLAQEKPGQTLEATALVHEAYVRLVGADGGDQPRRSWNGRGHFFAAAAEAMRRILIEAARRKKRLKHGGDRERVEIELASLPTRMSTDELIALDEALEKLNEHDPVKARLVTLRYFGGMTIEQAADVLAISRVTAHRYWTYARAWLHQHMTGETPG